MNMKKSKKLEIEIVQPYFTDEIRIRGKGLEDKAEAFLKMHYSQYKRNTHNGIDFIINGDIHLDCVAQGVSGSIGDKLPHKVWKYIKKYNLKDIYILHPYSPITTTVANHLMDLEKWMSANIHVIEWTDFEYLVKGGKFTIRKPYNHVKDSRSVKNNPTSTVTVNTFFNIKH